MTPKTKRQKKKTTQDHPDNALFYTKRKRFVMVSIRLIQKLYGSFTAVIPADSA